MHILIIDDSDEDYDVLIDCFTNHKGGLRFQRCKTGDEVERHMSLAFEKGTLPQIIILDLNLIGADGREVLKYLKFSEAYKSIPVLIFSTSSNAKDIGACYAAGANSYSCKPVNLAKFDDFVSSICHFWLNNVEFSKHVSISNEAKL